MNPYSPVALVLLITFHAGALRPAAVGAQPASPVAGALAGGGVMAKAKPALAGTVALPAPRTRGTLSLEEALQRRRSVRAFATDGLSLAELAQLLWAAQGITSRSGGRTAPSAGALYPLEVYVAVGEVAGLERGVYRYVPQGHRIELVATGDRRSALAAAALGQRWFEEAPAVIVFTAVYERITGKYRERGVRYAQLEAGHAAENLLLEVTALGLGAAVVGAFEDGRVREVLGLPASVEPLELVPVGWPKK
jgi:SagB-type dehydrogenase family enzyme